MQISENKSRYLHDKLPIDKDEKIIGMYKHHWFAYASLWITALFIVLVIALLTFLLLSFGDSDGTLSRYRGTIVAGVSLFCVLVLLGTLIPVYLRSQEQVVLTEEALLQMLQPSLFASKVDQLNLQHIADVSVRQDFFGSILGYGYITVETPGEQNNYRFSMLPNPHQTAREISQAHENYDAAMQSGRLPTTLGVQQQPAAPVIDPAQYQQFLQYQQMVAQSQSPQAQPATAPDQSSGPANESTTTDSAQPANGQTPPPEN